MDELEVFISELLSRLSYFDEPLKTPSVGIDIINETIEKTEEIFKREGLKINRTREELQRTGDVVISLVNKIIQNAFANGYAKGRQKT